jgi:hypothetical protein
LAGFYVFLLWGWLAFKGDWDCTVFFTLTLLVNLRVGITGTFCSNGRFRIMTMVSSAPGVLCGVLAMSILYYFFTDIWVTMIYLGRCKLKWDCQSAQVVPSILKWLDISTIL